MKRALFFSHSTPWFDVTWTRSTVSKGIGAGTGHKSASRAATEECCEAG